MIDDQDQVRKNLVEKLERWVSLSQAQDAQSKKINDQDQTITSYDSDSSLSSDNTQTTDKFLTIKELILNAYDRDEQEVDLSGFDIKDHKILRDINYGDLQAKDRWSDSSKID